MEFTKKQVESCIRKRRVWIVNVVLHYLLKFNPFRNKKIWIYGCWEGMRYDDNSKYFFEYMTKHHKEIKSVWMTNSMEIQKKLEDLGYEAYIGTSRKGIMVQLKAGVCFVTNGMSDIAPISFAHGAEIVGLWHGEGMKKTFYASKYKGNAVRQLLKKLKDAIYLDASVDFMVASSDLSRKLNMMAYKLKYNQCLVTGMPRNDVFKNKVMPSTVFSMDAADEYQYILYFPTHRPYKNAVIEDFILGLTCNEEFVKFLTLNKIRFVVKLHYLCRIDCNQLQAPFYLFTDDEVSGVQELLAASDCLITDFSSAIVDFTVQKKPTLLYAPDYEQMNTMQGIYDEWKHVYELYACKDVGEAAKKLIQMFDTGNDNGLSDEIRKMYENSDLEETCYCENVYRAVSVKVL